MLKTINNQKWLDSEITFLKDNFQNMTLQAIGDHLNRTRSSVKAKLKCLQLKKHIPKEWTEDECNLILNNRDTCSLEEIASLTGRTRNMIKHQCAKLSITKQYPDYITDFCKKTPEVAYTIGMIFADGHVSKIGAHTGKVEIKNQINDFIYIKPVLSKVSTWTYTIRSRKHENRKDIVMSRISSQVLAEFLREDVDLKNKNNFLSDKLLAFIGSKDLERYFLRGLFDGDGCAHLRKDNALSVSITSNCNFDWSNIVKLIYNNTGIVARTNTTNRSCGSTSRLLLDAHDAIRFLSYIYKGFTEDNIGFTRKFINYIRCLENRAISPYYSRMKKNSELLGV